MHDAEKLKEAILSSIVAVESKAETGEVYIEVRLLDLTIISYVGPRDGASQLYTRGLEHLRQVIGKAIDELIAGIDTVRPDGTRRLQAYQLLQEWLLYKNTQMPRTLIELTEECIAGIKRGEP